MAERNTGGPAFPVSTRSSEDGVGFGHQDSAITWQFPGMTLRDYFAAQAMQAVPMPQAHLHDVDAVYDRIAQHAWKMADAMLRNRHG